MSSYSLLTQGSTMQLKKRWRKSLWTHVERLKGILLWKSTEEYLWYAPFLCKKDDKIRNIEASVQIICTHLQKGTPREWTKNERD